MTRRKDNQPRPVGIKRRNCGAAIAASIGLAVLYLNFNPTPVGADPDELRNSAVSLPSDFDADFSEASTGPAEGKQAGNTDPDHLSGERAMLMKLLLLEKGLAYLQEVPDYTATVFTQERVAGSLLDPQIMDLKLRHEPLSIHMHWRVGDKGRELLFVDGQNEGDMLVRMGGIKKRLIPTLKLNPSGDTAMKEARHPATKIGMKELARQLVERRQSDLRRKAAYRCEMRKDRKFDDRPCYCFIYEFDSPSEDSLYRKSIVLIDKEWCVPVMLKNFTWPHEAAEIDPTELDEETVIEHYGYSNVQFNQKLADSEFHRDVLN